MPEQRILDFYVEQSGLTQPGRYARWFDDVAPGFYGFELPAERGVEKHLRTVEAMLERLLALDDRPLAEPRPVERRLSGRCHHFTVILLSMLRAKNIPARARCGFGAYFNPGYYEDHWVVEYWNAAEQRWVLGDPQFDDVWRERLQIQHNILDVPREQFLVAADAWNLCRRDAADPARFGAFFANLYGLWFVAGNLVRDVAALNKMESLPWDVWGGQPQPHAELSEAQREYFDELAALSQEPDATFDELQKRYATDELVHVPETVFNSILQRPEPFVPAPTPLTTNLLPRHFTNGHLATTFPAGDAATVDGEGDAEAGSLVKTAWPPSAAPQNPPAPRGYGGHRA